MPRGHNIIRVKSMTFYSSRPRLFEILCLPSHAISVHLSVLFLLNRNINSNSSWIYCKEQYNACTVFNTVPSTEQIFDDNWLPLKKIVNIEERGREEGEEEEKEGKQDREGGREGWDIQGHVSWIR